MVLSHTPAWANGKFPAADQLVVDPSDPSHIATMTTFGVLTTSNTGADWDLICEPAAMYLDVEPGVAFTAQGTLILGLTSGVGVGRAGGCDWTLAGGPTDPVIDVTRSLSEADASFAVSQGAGAAQVWASGDDAQTFAVVGVPLPAGVRVLTIDVAPTDGDVIYVSGVDTTNNNVGQLLRSGDRGMTWTAYDVPNSDEIYAPFIGAMDPVDPDIVYLRSSGGPGRVYVTQNGGVQIDQIYESQVGNMLGFALSPDGNTLLIAPEFEGLFRASTSDFSFSMVSEVAVRCLTWTQDALYVCVNQMLLNDGYVVGASQDAGDNITPLVSLECVRGILDCDAGTSVAQQCPALWPMLAEQLMSDTCGAGGAGGAGIGGQGGRAEGGAGATGGAQPPANGDDGCSCRVVAPPRHKPLGAVWHVAVAFMSIMIGRRMSHRRS